MQQYIHCHYSMDYLVIAQHCIIGADSCFTFENSDVVKGEPFVDTLGDGATTMPAAILLPGNHSILLSKAHHFSAHVLIQLT